jgi:hypothetical protein
MPCNLADGVPTFRRYFLPQSSGWIETVGSSKFFYIAVQVCTLSDPRKLIIIVNRKVTLNLAAYSRSTVHEVHVFMKHEDSWLYLSIHHETVSRATQNLSHVFKYCFCKKFLIICSNVPSKFKYFCLFSFSFQPIECMYCLVRATCPYLFDLSSLNQI